MTGRPTIRTDAVVDDILDRLTDGEPLAQILRDDGMPRPSTWYDWCAKDPDLSGRVARAREFGADAIAVDALRIADTPKLGQIVRSSDKEGVTVTSEDMLGHRKLQVDTRLKLLRCWDPKRYGDKLEIEGKQDMTLNVTIKRLAAPDVPALPEPGETE